MCVCAECAIEFMFFNVMMYLCSLNCKVDGFYPDTRKDEVWDFFRKSYAERVEQHLSDMLKTQP